MQVSERSSISLYLVHCGFYDPEVCDGLYESHVNYFIAANSFDDAKSKIRENPEFARKRMHIDGLQEITAVDGFKIELVRDERLGNGSIITSFKHRDLAKK